MVFGCIEIPEKRIPIFEVGVAMLQRRAGAMFVLSRPNLEGISRMAFIRAKGIKAKDSVYGL